MISRSSILKVVLLTPLFAALFPTVLVAETADEAYEATMSFYNTVPEKTLSAEARARESDKLMTSFAKAVEEFSEKYPSDPRKWELIVQMGYTPPLFISGFKPGFDDKNFWSHIERDPVKVAEFKSAQTKRLEAMLAASDANERAVSGGIGWLLTEAQQKAFESSSKENRAKYLELARLFWQRLPASDHVTIPAKSYLALLKEQAPAEVAEFQAELAASPIEALRELPNEEAKMREIMSNIATWSFTALDGREVDLGKMRGKVILVDFWATWCGPCVKELPNVKKAYEAYHDKGFEIVGVSLDKVGDREKLEKFVADGKMPWPQFFDGKGFEGEVAQKYKIKAIPAMILIGPDGKVLSTDARGEKLAQSIQLALGLN